MDNGDQGQPAGVPTTPNQEPQASSLQGAIEGVLERLKKIETKIGGVEEEVDSLQNHIFSKRKSWVDATVIVAFLALVFSAITTKISIDGASRQDVRNQRLQLGEFVQQISSLPVESSRAVAEYKDDVVASTNIATYFSQRQLMATRQAVNLIEDLKGDVTAADYYVVGQSLSYLGQYKQAIEFLNEGVLQEQMSEVEGTMLYRALGLTYFAMNEFDKAESAFSKALTAYPGQYPIKLEKNLADVWTSILWFDQELLKGRCAKAQALIENIDKRISMLSSGPHQLTYANQLVSKQNSMQQARSTGTCSS